MSTAAGLFAALRGGAKFDNKRFGGEMQRWGKGGATKTSAGAAAKPLDFFASRVGEAGAKSEGAGEKRKKGGGEAKGAAAGKEGKKRKVDVEDEEEEVEDHAEEEGEEKEEEEVDEVDEGIRLMPNAPSVRDPDAGSAAKQGDPSAPSHRTTTHNQNRCPYANPPFSHSPSHHQGCSGFDEPPSACQVFLLSRLPTRSASSSPSSGARCVYRSLEMET